MGFLVQVESIKHTIKLKFNCIKILYNYNVSDCGNLTQIEDLQRKIETK